MRAHVQVRIDKRANSEAKKGTGGRGGGGGGDHDWEYFLGIFLAMVMLGNIQLNRRMSTAQKV